MDDFTLFYAWQSDTPQKAGRYLIRDAAKQALKSLATDATVDDSPRLDSDTQDVAGTPDIANTIFNKIDACGLFLADVTFVGSTSPTDGESKPLPNPNVLLELGYATAKIGWDRVILVMNTAYGTPNNLIFDLRQRRWPMTFEVATTENDQIRQQRNNLAKDLRLAVHAAMQAEHAAVEDVIAKLDVNCLQLMSNAGKMDYFQSPQRNTTRAGVANQAPDNALVRLLELRVLRCDINSDGQRYAYHWTYLGKLVLQKLKFRESS